MKLYPLIFPFLFNLIYSTFADLDDSRGDIPTTSFATKLPKESNLDPSKAGFKKGTYRRFEKGSQPILPQPQRNPFSVMLRNCNSAGYATFNYSTPTRCPFLAPKNVYLHNTVAYSFTTLPIALMTYSTTTQPTTAPMTNSASAPAHETPRYDAATPPLYAASQPLTYSTTTPRTALPLSNLITMPYRQVSSQSPTPNTAAYRVSSNNGVL